MGREVIETLPPLAPEVGANYFRSIEDRITAAEALRQKHAEAVELAKDIVAEGAWKQSGEVKSYTTDVLGSEQVYPVEFRGTNFIPIGKGRKLALRERDAKGESARVVTALLLESADEKETVEVAVFDGNVSIHGLERLAMRDVINMIDLLHFIGRAAK